MSKSQLLACPPCCKVCKRQWLSLLRPLLPLFRQVQIPTVILGHFHHWIEREISWGCWLDYDKNTFAFFECVLLLIVISDKSHVLTEGPVDGNSSKTNGKDEAPKCDVEVGGPFHLIGVSLLDFLVREVSFGWGEEGGGAKSEPRLGKLQYFGKHDDYKVVKVDQFAVKMSSKSVARVFIIIISL